MEERLEGSTRGAYTEKLKMLIEKGLDEGHPLSRIQAEGRLVIMEYFHDELEQAQEWVKLLEIILMYGRAKDEKDRAGSKPSLFGRVRTTELGQSIRQLESEIRKARARAGSREFEARMAERRKAD